MRKPYTYLKLVALLLLFGGALAQKGQNATTPAGYIVTQAGDTLRGSIDFLDWDKMPTSIRFRADTAADFRKMSVHEIRSFGIPAVNQVYVSRKVTILEVTDRDYHIAPNTLLNLHVFMQVLLTGPKASVYQMRDGSQNGRFFIEKDGDLLELINQPFYRANDQGRFYVPGDLYREQLPLLCSDAASFRASNLPQYNETSMRRYFQRYNACFVGETVTYTSTEQRAQAHVGFLGGAETLSPSFSDEDKFERVRPTFGVSLRLSQPRRNYNRFIKLTWIVTPGFPIEVQSLYSSRTAHRPLHFLEFAGGSYFGRRALRPFVYATSTLLTIRGGKADIGFFIGTGLSYKRQWELEIGHPMLMPLIPLLFAPGNPLKYMFAPPRVAVHYYLKMRKD
ncbi:hypothetical protein [Tellurirhabdus rosea]|uniref:hypothetical protein n=1 Tax=Tellurirhabdus rosea TaxID=2674997 RepID=UPI00224E21A8|nr:hypothetical protein [Tellurirhabdus rosea]